MLNKNKRSISIVQGIMNNSNIISLKKRNVKDVFILEGRPSLEAAKKNSRLFLKSRIKPTIIADNMAGVLFYKNLVKEVWLSARFASKDGALCDIGALILAVCAKKHKIPARLLMNESPVRFFADQKEITRFNNFQIAPKGIKGFVPLVEWVPKKYITKVSK